jgi:hypothetical protein
MCSGPIPAAPLDIAEPWMGACSGVPKSCYLAPPRARVSTRQSRDRGIGGSPSRKSAYRCITRAAALDHLGPVVSLYGRVALRMRKATLGDLMIDADILALARRPDTKIAASFRVSLTALMPKPDHQSQMARAWLHIHAALARTWKQGVQVLRVDWPVYPRRAEHNTVAEGGNRR